VKRAKDGTEKAEDTDGLVRDRAAWTPRDLLAIEPEYPKWITDDESGSEFRRSEYQRFLLERDELRDELAVARYLARRGLPPHSHWPSDDPRRDEWCTTATERVRVILRRVTEGQLVTPANLHALEEVLAIMYLLVKPENAS
jgi:hypothetical protein